MGSASVCRDADTLYFAHAHAEEVTGSGGNRYVFRHSSQSETEGEAAATEQLDIWAQRAGVEIRRYAGLDRGSVSHLGAPRVVHLNMAW